MPRLLLIELPSDYQPEDGDMVDGVRDAFQHFDIPSQIVLMDEGHSIYSMVRATSSALACRAALRECMAAMTELEQQLQQMKPNFEDTDGAIQRALDDSDDAYKHAREALRK